MNRLIRISFGPFQLLDLKPGAVEPVKRHVLADQLGARLAAELRPFRKPVERRRATRERKAASRSAATHEDRRRQVSRARPRGARSTKALRPTSDRVRESVFNILAHGIGDFST